MLCLHISTDYFDEKTAAALALILFDRVEIATEKLADGDNEAERGSRKLRRMGIYICC